MNAVTTGAIRPNDRQSAANSEFKRNTGGGANSVANKFLADRKGKSVFVICGDRRFTGTLLQFDAYSLELESEGKTILVFKGPGVIVEG